MGNSNDVRPVLNQVTKIVNKLFTILDLVGIIKGQSYNGIIQS